LKIHWGRITLKSVFVLVCFGVLSIFDRLVNPALSSQIAHAQLQDVAESSATFSAYSWAIEGAWWLFAIIVVVFVLTEVLDMRSEAKKEEK
jgi:uncharacterized membrane protein